MKQSDLSKRADDIQVRVVVDPKEHGAASNVQVVSLSQAIQLSIQEDKDLIGTSLQSDPPVIRVTDLSKLLYQRDQAKQQKPQTSKQKKSFRFRAGIGDHDLDRKLKDMFSQLEKGVECEYTVFSKARLLRENAQAGMELVDRIQERIQKVGQFKKQPQVNREGAFIRVVIEPKTVNQR